MFLKFETNLRRTGSLATENSLHVAGFYTYLVELKHKQICLWSGHNKEFYTYLVELKQEEHYRDLGGFKSFIPT